MRSNRELLSILMVFISLQCGCAEPVIDRLTLMTYNCWNFDDAMTKSHWNPNPTPWQRRVQGIAEEVVEQGADVIAFQELRVAGTGGGLDAADMMADLVRLLGPAGYVHHRWYGIATYNVGDDGGKYVRETIEGHGVFSRLPFAEEPSLKPLTSSDAYTNKRAAIFCKIVLASGRHASVVTAHFSTMANVQLENAKELVALMEPLRSSSEPALRVPTFLIGDLNSYHYTNNDKSQPPAVVKIMATAAGGLRDVTPPTGCTYRCWSSSNSNIRRDRIMIPSESPTGVPGDLSGVDNGPPPFVVNAISSAIVGDGALSDHMAVVAAVNITWKSTLPVNACAAKCTCRGNRCYTKKRRLQ